MHGQRHQPRQRSSGLIIALAAAVFVGAAAVVVAALAIAYAGSPEAHGHDRATIRACEHAKNANARSDAAALKAAEDAVSVASTSDVAALREIADKYEPTGSRLDRVRTETGSLEISTWCIDHGMG